MDKSDLMFLKQDNYAPISLLFKQLSINTTIVWIDRANDIDSFSIEGIQKIFLNHSERLISNKILIIHIADYESTLNFEIRRYCGEFANLKDFVIELELKPLELPERIEIALQHNKTKKDAIANKLIAEIVEGESPYSKAIIQTWKDFIEEETREKNQATAGVLLSALLSAGINGPRQFTLNELRDIFTRQNGTFARWLKIFNKTPYHPRTLKTNLDILEKSLEEPLIKWTYASDNKRCSINPLIREILLKEITEPSCWVSNLNSFWVAYFGERFNTVKHKEGFVENNETPKNKVEDIVLLTHHLLNTTLPKEIEIKHEESFFQLATQCH